VKAIRGAVSAAILKHNMIEKNKDLDVGVLLSEHYLKSLFLNLKNDL